MNIMAYCLGWTPARNPSHMRLFPLSIALAIPFAHSAIVSSTPKTLEEAIQIRQASVAPELLTDELRLTWILQEVCATDQNWDPEAARMIVDNNMASVAMFEVNATTGACIADALIDCRAPSLMKTVIMLAGPLKESKNWRHHGNVLYNFATKSTEEFSFETWNEESEHAAYSPGLVSELILDSKFALYCTDLLSVDLALKTLHVLLSDKQFNEVKKLKFSSNIKLDVNKEKNIEAARSKYKTAFNKCCKIEKFADTPDYEYYAQCMVQCEEESDAKAIHEYFTALDFDSTHDFRALADAYLFLTANRNESAEKTLVKALQFDAEQQPSLPVYAPDSPHGEVDAGVSNVSLTLLTDKSIALSDLDMDTTVAGAPYGVLVAANALQYPRMQTDKLDISAPHRRLTSYLGGLALAFYHLKYFGNKINTKSKALIAHCAASHYALVSDGKLFMNANFGIPYVCIKFSMSVGKNAVASHMQYWEEVMSQESGPIEVIRNALSFYQPRFMYELYWALEYFKKHPFKPEDVATISTMFNGRARRVHEDPALRATHLPVMHQLRDALLTILPSISDGLAAIDAFDEQLTLTGKEDDVKDVKEFDVFTHYKGMLPYIRPRASGPQTA